MKIKVFLTLLIFPLNQTYSTEESMAPTLSVQGSASQNELDIKASTGRPPKGPKANNPDAKNSKPKWKGSQPLPQTELNPNATREPPRVNITESNVKTDDSQNPSILKRTGSQSSLESSRPSRPSSPSGLPRQDSKLDGAPTIQHRGRMRGGVNEIENQKFRDDMESRRTRENLQPTPKIIIEDESEEDAHKRYSRKLKIEKKGGVNRRGATQIELSPEQKNKLNRTVDSEDNKTARSKKERRQVMGMSTAVMFVGIAPIIISYLMCKDKAQLQNFENYEEDIESDCSGQLLTALGIWSGSFVLRFLSHKLVQSLKGEYLNARIATSGQRLATVIGTVVIDAANLGLSAAKLERGRQKMEALERFMNVVKNAPQEGTQETSTPSGTSTTSPPTGFNLKKNLFFKNDFPINANFFTKGNTDKSKALQKLWKYKMNTLLKKIAHFTLLKKAYARALPQGKFKTFTCVDGNINPDIACNCKKNNTCFKYDLNDIPEVLRRNKTVLKGFWKLQNIMNGKESIEEQNFDKIKELAQKVQKIENKVSKVVTTKLKEKGIIPKNINIKKRIHKNLKKTSSFDFKRFQDFSLMNAFQDAVNVKLMEKIPELFNEPNLNRVFKGGSFERIKIRKQNRSLAKINNVEKVKSVVMGKEDEVVKVEDYKIKSIVTNNKNIWTLISRRYFDKKFVKKDI